MSIEEEAEIQTTGARKSSGCVYLELLSSLAVSQMWREILGGSGGLH